MYNGNGLQTPRGSGTNGYTQTNKFSVKHNNNKAAETSSTSGFDGGVSGKAHKEILEHNRKRQVELKLLELEEMLVEHGYTEIEVTDELRRARESLEASYAAAEDTSDTEDGFPETEAYQKMAAQKKQELAALGIGFRGLRETS